MRTVLFLALLSLLASGRPGSGSAAAAAEPGAAPADSLARGWGPLPARCDSVTARPPDPPGTPAWKVALRAPGYAVGAPLWVVDQTVKGALLGLDGLGAFALTEQVLRGFRDPLGNYWLPDAGLDGRRGLEVGLLLQRPDFPLPGMRTRGRLAVSTRRARHFSLGALAPLGSRSWLELGGGTQTHPQADFYGLGRGREFSDDGTPVYHRQTDWFGAGWRQQLGGGFELTLHGFSSAVRAEDSDFQAEDAVDRVFADELPPGYGRTSSGLSAQLRVIHDTTGQTGRPAGGHRVVLLGHRFEPTDHTDTAHWTVGASVARFVGLGLPQRTLAFKGWWLRQSGLGDATVPFTRLLRNTNPHQLRGYATARFHTRGLVGASLEYRWPVWVFNRPESAGVDAYLFADAGQPHDDASELAWRHVFWSGGLGLRAVDFGGGFALKVELAAGREGAHVRVSGSQIFQDLKAGFHDGREPLPLVR